MILCTFHMTMLQNELYEMYFENTRSFTSRHVCILSPQNIEWSVAIHLFPFIAICSSEMIYYTTVTCQLLNHRNELCIGFILLLGYSEIFKSSSIVGALSFAALFPAGIPLDILFQLMIGVSKFISMNSFVAL
jgi:hypothetical protein